MPLMFRKMRSDSLVAALIATLITTPALADNKISVMDRAVDTARAALSRKAPGSTAQLSELTVVSVEPHTWRNSGLGCGPPRAVTSPVITDGFVVIFAASDGTKRRVHVAGSNAVVCDRALLSRTPRIALPVASVAGLGEKAREDLAQRLGVPLAEVEVVKFTPVRWADSALECPKSGEAVKASPVQGYRIYLHHQNREFVYHTNSQQVRPCPVIESQ